MPRKSHLQTVVVFAFMLLFGLGVQQAWAVSCGTATSLTRKPTSADNLCVASSMDTAIGFKVYSDNQIQGWRWRCKDSNANSVGCSTIVTAQTPTVAPMLCNAGAPVIYGTTDYNYNTYPVSTNALGSIPASYPVQRIGNLCWFSKNLSIGNTVYQDFSKNQPAMHNDGIIERYCRYIEGYGWYCYTVGGFYTYNEATNWYYNGGGKLDGVQGICPAGWRLPTADDVIDTINVLGGPSYAYASLNIGTVFNAINYDEFYQGGWPHYDNGSTSRFGYWVNNYAKTGTNIGGEMYFDSNTGTVSYRDLARGSHNTGYSNNVAEGDAKLVRCVKDIINVTCGEANGKRDTLANLSVYADTKPYKLCQPGTLIDSPQDEGNFVTWSCAANEKGVSKISCSAIKPVTPVLNDCSCGSANGSKQYALSLSAADPAICNPAGKCGLSWNSITDTGWNWTCLGMYGAKNSSPCHVDKIFDCACGSADKQKYPSLLGTEANICSDAQNCSVAFAPNKAGTGWDWTCNSKTGGKNSASCHADKATDCACGVADKQKYKSLLGTEANLCSDANSCKAAFAPNKAGTGWDWTCNSLNGGKPSPLPLCHADKIVDCGCGTANGSSQYALGGGTLCSPSDGISVDKCGYTMTSDTIDKWAWTCASKNGGTGGSCSALKKIDCSCGSKSGPTALSSLSATDTGLCGSSAACAVSAFTALPAGQPATSWSWTCPGVNGGTGATNCGAQKLTPVSPPMCGSADGGVVAHPLSITAASPDLCASGSLKDNKITTYTNDNKCMRWEWQCQAPGQTGNTVTSNICSASSDECGSSVSSCDNNCTGVIKDKGGNLYHKTVINGQCWLQENMNVGTQLNLGTPQSDTQLFQKYCANNLSVNCLNYGGLYQWAEALKLPAVCNTTAGANNPDCKVDKDQQGICPDGFNPTTEKWVVPTDEDWAKLESGLADPGAYCDPKRTAEGCSKAGERLKRLKGYPFWQGVLGGYASTGFSQFGTQGTYWSSTPTVSATPAAVVRTISGGSESVTRSALSAQNAASVRCIQHCCASTRWCYDANGDGKGNPYLYKDACEQPAGYVKDCSDIYDFNPCN